MGRKKSFKSAYLFILGGLLATGSVFGHAEHEQAIYPDKTEPQSASPPLEQKALDLLTEASDRLAAAGTLAVKVVVTDEVPNFPAAPLTYRTTSDVVMKKPDKLRVITSGDGPFSDFYYDGRMITEFSPTANFATATTAPPTIGGALIAAYNSAGIYFPFTAVILPDPYQHWAECVQNAAYIGKSRVLDGTATDLISYTMNGMLIQLWIGAQDRLPRMLLAVSCNDPLQLRHQLEFSSWQIDQPVSADAFNVNNAILARSESALPSGNSLPMVNTATAPVR